MVVRTDRHYTHGTKLTLLGSEVAVAREQAGFHFPLWLSEHTPDLGATPHAARVGVSLGQNIYTPTDISTGALMTARDNARRLGLDRRAVERERDRVTERAKPVNHGATLPRDSIGPPCDSVCLARVK